MSCFTTRGTYCTLLMLGLISTLRLVSSQDFEPPHIKFPSLQERVVVQKGKQFTLYCEAGGSPRPQITWLKDDKALDHAHPRITSSTNGSLNFQQFHESDNGLYQCMARNQYGTSLSFKVPLVLEQEPDISSSPEKETTEYAVEGEPYGLRCDGTPPSVPERIIRWYQTEGSRGIGSSKRVWTDSQGTMWFSHVITGDAKRYTCGLAPKQALAKTRNSYWKVVNLQVKSRAIGRESTKPTRLYKSPDMKAYINQPAILECFFGSEQPVTVTWIDNHNRVIAPDSDRFLLDNTRYQLTILKVSDEDEGYFTCKATNDFGDDSGRIRVNVTSAPMKLPNELLTSRTVPDGKKLTLKCSGKAAYREHLDSPVWYRNGELLTKDKFPDSQRYSFSQTRHALNIDNLDKSVDTACFQCNISNSEGYIFYDAYVRVIESIKIVKYPEISNEIGENDVIDIGVGVTGDPCCEIHEQYYHNNELLTSQQLQNPPFVYINSRTLLFNASSVSQEILSSWLGDFTFRAYSFHDSVTYTFSISQGKYTNTDASVLAGPEVSFLWLVLLVIGLLVLLLVALVVVFIIRRNYPKATYQLEKTELEHHLNPKQDLLDQSFQEI